MPLKSHADEWIKLRSKSAKRARVAEFQAAYGRPSSQDSMILRWAEQKRRALQDLVNFRSDYRFTFRAQMFKNFDLLGIKRRAFFKDRNLFSDILETGPRLLLATRTLRLQGVPVVFRYDEQPFWSHPSGFIPKGEIKIAEEHGHQFERFLIFILPGQATRMGVVELLRGHRGFWHIEEYHTDKDGAPNPGQTAHVLYTSHTVDAVDFRMRYDFSVISEPVCD